MRRLALLPVTLAPTAAKAERMTTYDSSNRIFGTDEHNGDRANYYDANNRRTGQSERRRDRADHHDSGDRSLKATPFRVLITTKDEHRC
jgi:hypothetical protein